MSEKMLKFTKLEQSTPEKRRESVRKEDFKEIYNDFISEKAQEQSSRCSQCGGTFLSSSLPTK